MSYEKISMIDLKTKIGTLKPNEVILDVRGVDEFKAGHLAGAINIPHDKVAAQANDLKKYERIYIHCQAGRRAQMAADALVAQGIKSIVCIAGSGMGDWLAAGLPVEK